jgi:formylmethanofuran dehydrogenase subunit C
LSQKLFLAVALFLLAGSAVSPAQTLKDLVNQPPDGALMGYLMTDGTVLIQGNACSDWWKLTPDINGSYINGTWKQMASLPSGYVPLYFAGAVLADGRVIVEGGEYQDFVFAFTDEGAIYDPLKNAWKSVKPPAGWGFIGDSPSAVLPDGKFLVGRKFDKRMATLDPATLTWTEVSSAGKHDENAEEGWTLMPDGSILTVDVKGNPFAEKYILSTPEWVTAGKTATNLQGPPQVGCIPYGHNQQYCPPGEIGPAILLTDGTVFATGALHKDASTGHTAVYHPGAKSTDPGTWTAGPDFPNGDAAGDSYATLLTNGRVLVEGNSGNLYEYDGKKFNTGPFIGPGYIPLITLPNGEVLVGGGQVYTSTGKYSSAWAPTIKTFPSTVKPGSTYKISGTQFNGLSQAGAFGDENQIATNYPLVRIKNLATGHIFYARTHNHSTMAVATGKAIVSTNFDVPASIETGASSLQVVSNGIPSKAVNITVN